ncbi:alpha/beta hydrolase [Chitinimonas sp.]|uniref:alpha/beta fold hydrolase n=1 Tax=Chitinimonas sp. TaxID=1934313 RepID=UPI002F931337
MSDVQRPWVLLRGLGREARHWGAFPAALGTALGGATVLTPDLDGNGGRHRLASATTIAGQLQGLRQQLAEVLAQGPVNVLALSLGGMVALEWAQTQPREVARLVLVNTSVASLNPFWQRLRWRNYPRLLSLPMRGLAEREATILAICSNEPAARAAALPQWQAWQRESPVSTANLLRQLAAAARYRPRPGWPLCPALIVCSRQDRLVQSICSRTLAQATLWPLRCHATAGHDLPLDAPTWLAAEVAAWVASLERGE